MAASKKNKWNKSIKKQLTVAKKKQNDFLKRRPHRSFRLTRRRDYKRNWEMPGYWAFTNEVGTVVWSQKWLFFKFMLLYGAFSFVIVGLLSQDNYKLLQETVNSLGANVIAGELSTLVQNVAIFSGVLGGAFNPTLTEAQQAYAGLLFLLGWMTMVWLLRQTMAGHKNIKLRDGLYSSGAPLIATFVIFLVVLLQMLPLAIALIAYGAAYSVNVFGDVLFTSLFWIIELLLMVISLYWITSSIVAMVVVTLPGMYPLKALKASSDLVIGRRLRVLYRLGWLCLTIITFWAVVILPMIAINSLVWLQNIPLVPLAVTILSAFSMVWASSYIYILYRKLVSDETPTA
ncbi:hypothetical protein A3F64_02635 [Candidatus Saccharibacteria bacterium RIFCSPHIGHO2_12_FULL_42_8]|nr:MAG: hypothetical protein A3F64_02635 [Candidatus Saccharibacteria bacterium RIFCSPHIGHO2_12_FULL_42_8]